MPIKISLIADVKAFLTGTKASEKALEDNADALDDLAREGDRATDKLERGFRDLARAGESAGKDVGKSFDDGFDKAGGGMEDFKSEAAGTARETAASFSGSADDIAGSFQEVAANALAGFGPAGAAAGLALAAGIGAFWTSFQENAEKSKQAVQDMYDDMIESGNAFLSQQFKEEQFWAIIKGADEAMLAQGDLKRLVELTGETEAQVARQFVESAESRAGLMDKVKGKLQEYGDKSREVHSANDIMTRGEEAAIQDIVHTIEHFGTLQDQTAQKYRDAEREARLFGDASEGSAARAGDAYDSLGRRLDSLKSPTITPTVDLTTAERQMSEFVRRSRTATVGTRLVQQPV